MYSTAIGEVLYRYHPAGRWCYWIQLYLYWFSAGWICPHQIEEYWKLPTITVHSFISSCRSRGLYRVCFDALHSKLLQSCWLCKPTDYRLPGSSVHGILQARILEWVATPFLHGCSLVRYIHIKDCFIFMENCLNFHLCSASFYALSFPLLCSIYNPKLI